MVFAILEGESLLMLNKILTLLFYILFAFTPLFWGSRNYELFEYNKMMLVYGLTIIITAVWLIKMIRQKQLILKRTPLDIFLLLFLAANILSTIFSVDQHTSIWGYYSRSNGGLLSTISYILLYYALVSNFTKEYVGKFLKAAVFGGLVVALYAIPEHFGVSPSCVLLTGSYNDACWVQDVQARVFATLGQPNWLAAYLAMVIFPAAYFLLQAKNKLRSGLYLFIVGAMYMAIIFTKSRSGALGLLGGALVFLSLFFYPQLIEVFKKQLKLKKLLTSDLTIRLGSIGLVALLLTTLYGSALFSRFEGINLFNTQKATTVPTATTQTQLEVEGGETWQIRLIVWKGALDIFKHYPFFGSGVETFAYTYYQFRPMEHNMVSEWDFLYNKAHNEYLNYLATTGLVGFISYMAVILAFIGWCIRYCVSSIKGKDKTTSPVIHNTYYLILAVLASYISYLIQNSVGFSVVVVALFFYLFPGLAFMATDTTREFTKKDFAKLFFFSTVLKIRHYCINNPKVQKTGLITVVLGGIILALFNLTSWFTYLLALAVDFVFFLTDREIGLIWRRTRFVQSIVLIIALSLLFKLVTYWQADLLYAAGSQASEAGRAGAAYNELYHAMQLNPGEPLYQSELSYAAAAASASLASEDATLSGELKQQAVDETNKILTEHPFNVSFYRTAIRTYFMLSSVDKSYAQKTIDLINKTSKLAPTDPKLVYNKALILNQMGQNTEAATILQKVLQMKPNYKEAYLSLGDVYMALGQKDKAVEEMNQLLKIIPNDPQALEKLASWEKQ